MLGRMMMNRSQGNRGNHRAPWRVVMTLTMSLLCALLNNAQARHVHDGSAEARRTAQDRPAMFLVQGGDIGPNAAADAARRATGGRILRVQRQGRGDGVVYRVKVLLPGGKVRTVRVDGASGAVY